MTMNTDPEYIKERLKAKVRAELHLSWLSPEKMDEWVHKTALLRSGNAHLLSGGKWSRGPSVLK
jgi:hypothetical protein